MPTSATPHRNGARGVGARRVGRLTAGARPFPTPLFFLTLLVVTSRGLLQILIGKNPAYIVQAVILALFIVVLILRSRARPSALAAPALTLWWLLLITAILSVFASIDIAGAQPATIYAVVMVFLAGLPAALSGLRFSFADDSGAAKSIVVVTIVMIVVALLQQFANLTLFPGTDLGTLRTEARPSAMTGSFLHYPIILALLGFILLGIHSLRGRQVYLLTGIAALAAVVISYSRSGMLIVLIGLVVGVFAARKLSWLVRALVALPFAVIALTIAIPADNYVERFLSIFRADGAGNAGRIDAWVRLLDLWSDSPLFIGSHAGQYTNITSNFSAAGAVASPESGLLQILVSLGILGVICFYGLLLVAVLACPSDVPWFRAGLIAAIVQSFVYQSIEVLPFMTVFALTPLIAALVRREESPSPAAATPIRSWQSASAPR